MEDKVLSVKWNIIQLKCGECGQELTIKNGPWGCFYCCTGYPKCFNRMNSNIYDKILDKITEMLIEHPNTNFTGYRWQFKTSYQYYAFKIIKHSPDKFVVAVTNIKKRKIPY